MSVSKNRLLIFCTASTFALISSQALVAQNVETSDYETDAGVAFATQYTDNVFKEPNDRRTDLVTSVSPWVELTYSADDFRLNVEANADIARYADYSSENYEDYYLGAEVLYRTNEDTFLFGGLDYALGHESRESPDDVTGLRPTELQETSSFFGVGGNLSDRTFRLGFNLRDLDYEDAPASVEPIDNDDRDRRQIEIGGRLGVAKTENGEVFVQGIYDQRDYDQAIDNQGRGYQRSSEGYQAAIGYTGSIGSMRGEVLLGVMSQDYDDPRFDTTTTLDFGANLSMPLVEGTTLDTVLERSIEETTISDVSGYVSSTGGLRLRHRFADDLSFAAYAFLSQNDYQNISRTDLLTETGVSLRYHFNPKLYLDADYEFRQRQSDVAGAEFDQHRISLTLGTALEPQYDAAESNNAQSTGGGFFLGALVGHNALHTKVDGPRGSGGNLTADFGDDGISSGLFGGYRSNYGSLEFGLEGEIEFNDTSWPHDGDRQFALERGNAYTASATAGMRTDSGNLLYTRFGVISAKFDSTYQEGTNSLTTRSTRETGLLVGIGGEFPLGDRLAARMEYQLRAYDDYWIGSPATTPEPDNFANVESVARFGLVYDLGSKKTGVEKVVETDFSGAYAGFQLGHGTLQSDNTGPRPNATSTNFILDTTRAGQGFTGGVFAGYGIQANGLYIGGEVEAELSSANWNIERSPEGRVYSIKKKNTIGAALRLGYLLNDNVLIYLRGGPVRSEFEVDYRTSGTSAFDNPTLDGIRFGAGIEFAIAQNTHARLDFTQTDYDPNSITYGASTDSFDTSERTFRIGLTRKF